MAFAKRAAEIFRDFLQPLNPLSGAYKPPKADVRAWGKEVEGQLAALAVAAGFDPSILNELREDLDAETAARLLTDIIATRADGLRRQKSADLRYVAGTPRLSRLGNSYGASDLVSWAVGTAVPKAVENPTAWLFYLSLDRMASITLRVYSRPGDRGNGNGAAFVWPGELAGADKLLSTSTTSVRDLSATPGNGNLTPVVLPLDTGPMVPGFIYFAVLTAVDAAGAAVPITLSRGRQRINDSVDPLWKSGLFRTAGSSGSIAPSDGGMVAHALFSARYTEAAGTGLSNAGEIRSYGDVPRFQINAVNAATWSVTLPEIEIDNQPDVIRVNEPGDVVAVSRVTVQNVFNEAATLTYNVDTPIENRYVDVIQLSAGGTILTAGVHYSVNGPKGTIRGLQNVAPRSVSLNYNFGPTRYDDIVADPRTGQKLVVQGQERARDPNEYLPQHQGFPTVARIFVTRYDTEVIRVDQFNGFCRKGREAAYADRLAYNRRCLPKTFALLNAGQPLRLAGGIDSITTVGGGSPYLEANGNRDLLAYLIEGKLPADTLATIPKYDGPAGAGQHIRIGWGWAVKAAMEARYGSIVEWRNWGIPGTTSETGFQAGGAPNFREPNRLAAFLADQCDLFLYCTGMNERGTVETDASYNNAVATIQDVQARGGEVLVITPPRPSALGQQVIDEWWIEITRKLVRAAKATNSAYVDLSEIMGPGNEGAIGLSPRTMSEQNFDNHPFPYEFSRQGAYIAETFVR